MTKYQSDAEDERRWKKMEDDILKRSIGKDVFQQFL